MVHDVYAAPSRLQRKATPDSVSAKVNVGLAVAEGLAGFDVMVGVGGATESTVQEYVTVALWSDPWIALTRKACEPWPSAEYDLGLVHTAKGAASRLHCIVVPLAVVMVNVADVEEVSAGPDVMTGEGRLASRSRSRRRPRGRRQRQAHRSAAGRWSWCSSLSSWQVAPQMSVKGGNAATVGRLG